LSFWLAGPTNLPEFNGMQAPSFGDISAMRSKITLCLVGVALGLGIGGAARASIDLSQRAEGPDITRGLVPVQGNFRSGFAAIKTDERHNLKADPSAQTLAPTHGVVAGLTRPEGAWADGRAALPGRFSYGSDAAKQRTLMIPPGSPAASNGLAALKASSSRVPSDEEVQSLHSQVADPAAINLLSRPSK
jgi:hypothetical protein